MKLTFVLLLFGIFLIGCDQQKKESTTVFLQQDAIALVPPRLMASSMIIDSFSSLTADLRMEGVELRYTTDGASPTASSTLYQSPLTIRDPGIYTFKAFHTSWKPSEATSINFYPKGQRPDEFEWRTAPSEKYPGSSSRALINQQKASLDFSNNEWVGFDTTAVAIVRFKKEILLKEIQLGYLSDPASWIFPPVEVEVIIENAAGKHEAYTILIEPLTEAVDRSMQMVTVAIGQAVNAVEIKVKSTIEIPNWHEGKGSKGWLFMDEFFFY